MVFQGVYILADDLTSYQVTFGTSNTTITSAFRITLVAPPQSLTLP